MPTSKQRLFLESEARIVILLGGNQIGKTTVGWANALAHTYGYRFWEVDDLALHFNGRTHDLPSRDRVPAKYWVRNAKGDPLRVPNCGFIVTGLAARRGIGDVLYEKFQELWPKTAKIDKYYMMGGVPSSFTFPNGSKIVFGSGEQTELNTEGITLNWAWIDEPVPQRIYSGLWRGLLRNFGRIFFTLTPLGARAAWIHNDLISKRSSETSVETIQAGMADNPYLDPDAIREFEKDPSFSESERQARVFGKFEHLSSRVWPCFHDGAPYVIEPFAIPRDWPRLLVVDPHSARPWAMAWAAISPSGVLYFYREHPEEEYTKLTTSVMTIQDYALLIRRLEGKEDVKWRVIDPNYGIQRRLHLGFIQRSIQEEIGEYGLAFDERVDDSLERGLAVVGDMLKYDESRDLSPDNMPKILIFNTCRNLIAALNNFAYVDSKSPDRRSERMSEEFKDFADVVRYAAVYERPNLTDSFSYLETPYTWEDNV